MQDRVQRLIYLIECSIQDVLTNFIIDLFAISFIMTIVGINACFHFTSRNFVQPCEEYRETGPVFKGESG